MPQVNRNDGGDSKIQRPPDLPTEREYESIILQNKKNISSVKLKEGI